MTVGGGGGGEKGGRGGRRNLILAFEIIRTFKILCTYWEYPIGTYICTFHFCKYGLWFYRFFKTCNRMMDGKGCKRVGLDRV